MSAVPQLCHAWLVPQASFTQWFWHDIVVLRSLRDMLYRRRMERQLAQARGLMSGEGKMPPPEDDVSHLYTL